MKTVTIILISIFTIVLIAVLARTNQGSKYAYTISYNMGRYSSEDFTNGFEYLPGNATIRYVNENGDSIYRSGSFSIKRNYKK